MAKKSNRIFLLEEAGVASVLFKLGIPTMVGVVLIAFTNPIVSLFGTDTEMVCLAEKSLRLNAILFITFGFQMVYASLYLAIGKSLVGCVLSLSRQGIFFFPLVLILPRLFGLNGVIWIQPMADLLTMILTMIFAVKINHALSAGTAKEVE